MDTFIKNDAYGNSIYNIDGVDKDSARKFVENNFCLDKTSRLFDKEEVSKLYEDIKDSIFVPKRSFNIEGIENVINERESTIIDLLEYIKVSSPTNIYHLERNNAGFFLVKDSFKNDKSQISLYTHYFGLSELKTVFEQEARKYSSKNEYNRTILTSTLKTLSKIHILEERSGLISEKHISLNSPHYLYDWSAKPFAGQPQKAFENFLCTLYETTDSGKVLDDTLKLILGDERMLEKELLYKPHEEKEEKSTLYESLLKKIRVNAATAIIPEYKEDDYEMEL